MPSVFAFRQLPPAAAAARQERAVWRQLQLEAQSVAEEHEIAITDVGAEMEVVPHTSNILLSKYETAYTVQEK